MRRQGRGHRSWQKNLKAFPLVRGRGSGGSASVLKRDGSLFGWSCERRDAAAPAATAAIGVACSDGTATGVVGVDYNGEEPLLLLLLG